MESQKEFQISISVPGLLHCMVTNHFNGHLDRKWRHKFSGRKAQDFNKPSSFCSSCS